MLFPPTVGRMRARAPIAPVRGTVTVLRVASMRACGSLAQLARLRALRVLDLRFECAYFLEFLFAHADPLAGEWLLGHAAADASYAQLDAVMAGAHARAGIEARTASVILREAGRRCAREPRLFEGGDVCRKILMRR